MTTPNTITPDMDAIKAFLQTGTISRQHMDAVISINKQTMNNGVSAEYGDLIGSEVDDLLILRYLGNLRDMLTTLLANQPQG